MGYGHELEKLDDWFSSAAWANRAREEERQGSPMSSVWGRKWRKVDVLTHLQNLRDTVRSIVRIHGVPAKCKVELAVLGQAGAAAAGFEDSPKSFTRPYILLDKTVWEECAPEEVRDVYCGVGLHEAGHILYTRDGFRRFAQPLPRIRRLYDDLWEDERIEELVRRDSPGFGAYLQAMKKTLLEHGQPGRALENWLDLPDLDFVHVLMFAFIRLPHLVDDRMRNWRLINDECLFDTLRSTFPAGPSTEFDVDQYAIECERSGNA